LEKRVNHFIFEAALLAMPDITGCCHWQQDLLSPFGLRTNVRAAVQNLFPAAYEVHYYYPALPLLSSCPTDS
jgi:hypothetical protein